MNWLYNTSAKETKSLIKVTYSSLGFYLYFILFIAGLMIIFHIMCTQEMIEAAGEEEKELAQEMAGAFLREVLPEDKFGSPKAGPGMWASVIRIMNPSTVGSSNTGWSSMLNIMFYRSSRARFIMT